MKLAGIFALVFLFFTACHIQDGGPRGVFIRVHNNSDVSFESVTVQSGNQERTFGEVLSRSQSEYRQFDYAFRYGSVWLRAGGRDFSLIPDDYVGETPLRDGYYTYRVGLSSANLADAELTFDLVEDD
ncbi:hypothetical protein J0A68_13385 [Algoriphagus sp. H41]|uniref:DUF4377 domain-containing protein n=1 Tax=Algoriphagus oliviformis TaxID=2811231 RepID=A0ABS3C4A9_9BACT|nr:hypothetical protein [Algoriphagus oliviformis]MBN7811940.1 hypothetical protein [Algoriphagus oliviformis]